MDKILVLGGTGVMGKFLVDSLSKDYQVYVTTRSKKSSMGGVSYICGNAHDDGFIERVIKGNRYKAIIDFMNYGTQEYKNRYELLLNNTEQLIFISSARVYADSDIPITEDSARLLEDAKDKRFLQSDDYALSKAREEDLLRKSGKKNWTIVRPYMTYSAKKLDLGFYPKELWLYRVLKGKSIVFTEDVAEAYTTLTYGEDVANGIISLLGKKDAKGRVFHITTDESHRWIDIISLYSTLLLSKGYKLNVIIQPKSELPSENIYRYDRCYNRRFNNERIKNFIDTSSFKSLKDGLEESLNEFLKRPEWGTIDWKKQAYWDSVTKEFTRIASIPSLKNKVMYFCFRYLISYPFVYNLTHRI